MVNPHGWAPENKTQELNGAAEKGEDEKKLNWWVKYLSSWERWYVIVKKVMMVTPAWNSWQLPAKVTEAPRMAELPVSAPLLSSGCPFTKIHIPSRNGNFIIFYLSAQKLNLSKNKLLCFILYLLMPFLRLQGFIGKLLPKDTFAKSNTTCNGWGTTCPRKRSDPRIHPPCNFPSLSYFPSAPSPNSYNQEKNVYVPSQV